MSKISKEELIERKYIKPYHKLKGLYYTDYYLQDLDRFRKKTEKYFELHNGIYILYNSDNKPIIKFDIFEGKMKQIYKTTTSGYLYPLFDKWKKGYTRL